MAAGIGSRVGGILGLLELCEQHGEAIEADLIRAGVRLRDVGSPCLTWRDLAVLIRQSPQDSALLRAMNPDRYRWGQVEHLLADLVDVANLLLWSKTKDGSRGRNRPSPYPRPGVNDTTKRRVRGDAVPLDQVHERLAAVRARQE
ncbi:DUF5361 domain-containing protein [Nocardia sp. CNY236]|uniref:DUF5361 domain-containing protein n=1 Tax=Nocardia sp. CNY236 TaxID=1169152 RepID=UPI00040CD2D3|nr:DUF5361 domain-containing protein [Nocardia sp. CNY236]